MAKLFSGHAHDPDESAFRAIRQLLPGHSVNLRNGQLETVRIDSDVPGAEVSRTDPIGQFKEAFHKAVADAAPRPSERAAIMLSGGMDSGPVAAVASKQAEAASSRPLIVSWKLSEFPQADEARWICAAADYLELDRELFEASNLLPFSAFNLKHVTPDFPIYNAFRPLVLEAYRSARRNQASIILNASGGDLTYPHPSWVLNDQLTRFDLTGAIKTLSVLLSSNRQAVRFGRRNLRYLIGRLLRGNRLPLQSAPDWLTPHAAEQYRSFQLPESQFAGYRHPQYAQNLLTSAHGTAHENAFSNLYGLDRRDPFQNPQLVDLMIRLPFSLSHREGKDKWIMREAMRGLLPEEFRLKGRTGLLHTFYEAGFNLNRSRIAEFLLTGCRDWESWVQRDYLEQALSGERTAATEQLVVARCVGYTLWRESLRHLNERGPR